jgi:hypothetical protein
LQAAAAGEDLHYHAKAAGIIFLQEWGMRLPSAPKPSFFIIIS